MGPNEQFKHFYKERSSDPPDIFCRDALTS
jgi:hypothetical protein